MLRKAPWAVVVAVFVMAVVAVPSFSGTTGKLSGKVVSEKNEPLAGVNVRVEGQRVGAITDDKGEYAIIGVLAGTYLVRANLLGYAAFAAQNVTITPDFTTELNIQLKSEAVQMEEVRVDAQRPLLQKDATGTTRFITSEDMQKLPTRGYRDAAAQQSGVVNFQLNIDTEAQNSPTLIVRGGRPNETAYFVDGFSQQDPLTGTSSTSISNNAIEEVVLLTGGFAPEYGRIMSGAVNVITREGGAQYTGALEAVTDAIAGDWISAPVTDYNIYDLSLGGPVIPGYEKITFYLSGERRWQRDRQPSHLPGQFQDALAALDLPAGYKPHNSSSGGTFQAKVAWQMTEQDQVKVGTLSSHDQWSQYLHTYLFNLDHAPRYEDQNQSYFGTLNHVFNSRSFATLGVNYFDTLRKRGDGLAFDDLSKYFVDGGNPLFDGDIPVFWDPGHVFDDYLQRRSSYWGVMGGWTSQIDPYNQLKAGGDLQMHTLRYFNHFFPARLGGADIDTTNWDGYGYGIGVDAGGNAFLKEVNEGSDGPKHPKTWSLYLQDKYERSGLIVNGGLRYDYINVDTPALISERYPLGDPDAQGNNPDLLETGDLQENKVYTRISPRLGVAFPVDEKTVLRVNYGQFYQQPNLQDLYVSYRFLEHKVRTGGYFVGFGNPNLRPERTSAYEVGVQRVVGTGVRIDATAYYKDVKDLVEITNIPSSPKSFSSYRNRDFATIKGVDFGISMRPINRISGALSYSLSFAQGTGSVSNSHSNIAWVATEVPKETAPLDFDQRHKLSMNLDYRMGKGEGPAWGGIRWIENFGLNALLNVASGTPYTPTKVYNEVTLAAVASEPSGPVNSRYSPWTMNLDLKASKLIPLAGFNIEAFLWGLNVLNNRNPVAVYSSTGSPVSTNWLNTDDGQAFLNNTGSDGAQLYDLATNNPNIYANPRLFRFGLRASF